ncbi:hypothetical protein PHYSODRAFT_300892 [Phytophthora sojae]|uniref:Uncharacterized protein n=1 Tax=Phytophthora sojae (strain P6497) TaxID=1094619 RepID=G4ZHI1_PHYSP|nr:hypothetical protein PHYSODRAFT_300892 [Phytophthora sojae]EGZ18061.1 hypothetical protein PHYSODRAFT_300892 [Phytophthora sojae]|eukprot:XP_009527119.1 hypothetical protein PHYSODRAFT_300892 [Phytophthora sojae]
MFVSSASDREMMEEVLELLATDSPNDDDNTVASSRSSSTATNHSSIDYHSTNGTSQDHRGRSEFLDWSEVAMSPRCDCEEEEKDARHPVPGRSSTQAQRQRREAVLGVEQQMPSMYCSNAFSF